MAWVYKWSGFKSYMTTRYHLLTSAEAQIEAVANSPCISLIDESSPTRTEMFNQWTTFRNTYPLRPHWLIQVAGGTRQMGVPTNMQTSILNDPLTRAFIRSQVGLYGGGELEFPLYDSTPDASVFPNGITRDGGNPSLATDLFALCELSSLQPGDNVFLFVDNSGSMRVPAVRSTLDLLESNCIAAGINISSVFNPSENYVLPFISWAGSPGVPQNP